MDSPRPAGPADAFQTAETCWQKEYDARLGAARPVRNRSGIEVKALYTPRDWDGARYLDALGFPGQPPNTRGIYPTMHRGRAWTQRQLIGLGSPEDYNQRLHEILAAGGTAVQLVPCNSVFRGLDADQVDPVLLGTCGVVVNTVEDMEACLRGVPLEGVSVSLNDPSPFTLLAMLLALARRRGVARAAITGTSNQSDYISHFVANHMFFRLSLPGARRILADHVAFATRAVPGWNPVSVVGQHMQQAGATPAQTMAFTLSTAIQYAEDCIVRGLAPDAFLPRMTFFFDISISFFEEVAKFRAGRRLWSRITRERLGACDPRSWRFKFHGQTSGVDLTRQQPLNNVARATVQAMAGIFGGLQSLHTDAYDEAFGTPTAEAARVAVSTQNILREEAHLTDVIDPLGGSYYVERLTDQMEEEIGRTMAQVEAAGGMYAAVESGLVQKLIGESALAFQLQVESGEQTVVGVNAYPVQEASGPRLGQPRPDPTAIDTQLARLRAFKTARSGAAVTTALDALAAAAQDPGQNVFERVVGAAEAGATHGEIVAVLRREMGSGEPLVAV
ncbi:MAG: acyl-CoA mutase large subunit family protein [Candidatus Rokubacteria bacterium]|nr:acyl-CoA mutase large subunit family protein [Candidatus Rokubacteria bacterium]MBI3104996.1 acyl-CoA mutase large subunit family protein [Candidatus Rokubacteria bacterium]